MNTKTTPYLHIGIDELRLYNIGVMAKDLNILDDRAKYDKNVTHTLLPIINPPERQTVEFIKIIDNCKFADLIINVVQNPSGFRQTYVDLCLRPHYIRGDNLNSLTLDEYKVELVDIYKYIAENYGVYLDFRNAQIKSMEINTTFSLLNKFSEYERVARLLLDIISGKEKLKKIKSFDDIVNETRSITSIHEEPEFYSRENGQYKIKIYDKSSEMHDNDHYDTDTDYMRVELTLKTAPKIERVFGSKRLNEITDNMTAEFFYTKIRVDYFKRYEKWREQNKKDLKQLVKEFRKPNIPWQHDIITYCFNFEKENKCIKLLDINDLKEVIEKDKHNNRARTIKAFDHHKAVSDLFFRNDRDKVTEIMAKIDEAYRNSIYESSGDV